MTPINRRDFLVRSSAIGLAIVAASGESSPAPPVVASNQRLPVGLRVEHVASTSGVVTIISRRFERPDLCQLCPMSKCNHEGGLCVVRVPRFVDPADCGLYQLKPPIDPS